MLKINTPTHKESDKALRILAEQTLSNANKYLTLDDGRDNLIKREAFHVLKRFKEAHPKGSLQ